MRRDQVAPSAGQKGAGIIRDRLRGYGLELANQPLTGIDEKEKADPKRVQMAIRVLEKHGYEVRRI